MTLIWVTIFVNLFICEMRLRRYKTGGKLK